jgi:hypothetical protein
MTGAEESFRFGDSQHTFALLERDPANTDREL